MRVRYQTNPKIALLGILVSLGMIYGAQEAQSVLAARNVEAKIKAAGEVVSVESATTLRDIPLDQQTC